MVQVKRKEGESLESLLRRFTKRVQQSGVLIRARKGKYFESPKNKREIKEEALRRKSIKEKKEYLRKIGKLDDLTESRYGRSRRPMKKILPRLK